MVFSFKCIYVWICIKKVFYQRDMEGQWSMGRVRRDHRKRLFVNLKAMLHLLTFTEDIVRSWKEYVKIPLPSWHAFSGGWRDWVLETGLSPRLKSPRWSKDSTVERAYGQRRSILSASGLWMLWLALFNIVWRSWTVAPELVDWGSGSHPKQGAPECDFQL